MARDGEFGDIEVNLAGVRAVLRSKAVSDEMERRARLVRDEANRLVGEKGHGYEDGEFFKVGGPRPGDRKSFVTVYGAKDIAHAMQARHDVLTRAIDAGKGDAGGFRI